MTARRNGKTIVCLILVVCAIGIAAPVFFDLETPLRIAAWLVFGLAAGYAVTALFAAIVFARGRGAAKRTSEPKQTDAKQTDDGGAYEPSVSVLKPLCGLDFELYENLRTYCLQDYPRFEVLFGVRDSQDPAIAVVERLIDEFPDVDLKLVVNPRLIGTNYKVSNVANLWQAASADIAVISDSDVRVGPDYLSRVVEDFAAPGVGAVTCLYTASAAPNLASRLGALYLAEWYMPSVMVHVRFQALEGCFGQTMAFSREAFDAIGGFEPIASQLADDFVLGYRIREQGFKIALSSYLVDNVVDEASLRSLFLHELRWARTIFSLNPVGYFFSFVTHTIAVSLVASLVLLWLGTGAAVAAIPVVVGLGLRLSLHVVAGRWLSPHMRIPSWLVPLRDFLNLAIWALGLVGRSVQWRGTEFILLPDGNLAVVENA